MVLEKEVILPSTRIYQLLLHKLTGEGSPRVDTSCRFGPPILTMLVLHANDTCSYWHEQLFVPKSEAAFLARENYEDIFLRMVLCFPAGQRLI